MRTTFVIHTHSFVDLITNSSSELFICDTKKSKEQVEKLLRGLLDFHNEAKDATGHYTFDGCFKPVTISPFVFDLEAMPDGIYAKYKSYSKHDYGRVSQIKKPDAFYAAQEAEEAMSKVHPFYTKKWSPWDKQDKAEKEEHDKLWQDLRQKDDEIWTEFGAQKLEVSQQMFVNFLTVNGFSPEIIDIVTKLNKIKAAQYREGKNGEWGGMHYCDDELPKEVLEAFEFFSEGLSWGLRIQKGNILVRSADDNTIPWAMMDLIGEYFNASRYHLG